MSGYTQYLLASVGIEATEQEISTIYPDEHPYLAQFYYDTVYEPFIKPLQQQPTNGGKPSKGTSADKRLTRNKPAPKPATMPAKKTGK